MKRRILSIITALALCLSLCPAWAFAIEGEPDTGWEPGTGLCAHGEPVAECHICPIEDLTAALPWAVTEDNAERVRSQLDEILDLYRKLTWEEQELVDLSHCWELQAELDAANDPAPIPGEVSYQTCDTDGKNWTTGTVSEYTEITAENAPTTWASGWYVVTGDVTISGRVTVSGSVHLILADGCSLATGGITVEPDNSLSIYGMGSLTATTSEQYAAGIGGSARNKNGGTITIYGGNITAANTDTNNNSSAGIGGGNGASGGTIAIHGGNVEATGSGIFGVGIGGYNADGTTILITGGTVTAKGASSRNDTKGDLTFTGGILNGEGGCTVTFVTSDQSVTIPNQTISEGKTAVQPEIEGWILTFFTDTGYTIPFDFGKAISESITIYVQCEKNTDYIATVNGTNYTSVTGFVDAIKNASGEVTATLLKDVDLGDTGRNPGLTVPSGVTLTLDCGEFTLTGSGAQTIWVNGTLNFTSGTICNTEEQGSAIYIFNDGKFRMSGGEVVNMSAEMKAVGTVLQSTVTILGGNVGGGGLGLTYTPAGGDKATLSGGTYSILQAGYYSDGNTSGFRPISEILAEGYALKGENGLIEGAATGRQENVTVVKCTHPGQTVDLGNGTHGAAGEGSTCIYCGTEIEPAAHTLGTNNMCADCGVKLAVKVDAASAAGSLEPVYFDTIENAWAFLDAPAIGPYLTGATITLLDDVTVAAPLTVEGSDNITFDGGAYTLTSTAYQSSVFEVTGGQLTVQSGIIVAKGFLSDGIKVNGGTLVVVNGKIEAGRNGIHVGYGSVQISGGEIIGPTGLFTNGDGSVQISGGTFKGASSNSKAIASYEGKVSELLAHTATTRYAFYLNGVPVTEGLDGKSLPAGPYEVKPCTTHVYQETSYAHTEGELTHTQTCAACGAVEEVDCIFTAFGTTGAGTATNIKLCACGSTLTASAVNADNLVYNGQKHEPKATFIVDNVTPAEVKVFYTYISNINAGTGALMATANSGTFSGILTVPFTIEKATPVVTWNGGTAQTLTYTGQPAAVTADVELVNDETGTVSYSYAKQGSDSYIPGLPTDVGTYSVKASFAEQQNYHSAEAVLTLTIDPLEITVTPDSGQHKEYGAADPALTYTVNPGLIGGDQLSGALTYVGEDVGTYPITQGTLAAPSGNYTLKFTTGVMFEITKPSLEKANVTVSGTHTYNGTAQVPASDEVTVKLGDTVIASNQYTISTSNNVNAGTATVTVTAAENGNYSGGADGTFKIDPAPLTIKANDQTITYGQSIETSQGSITWAGLCAGDNVDSFTLTPSTANVPGGTITPSDAVIANASGEDMAGNYAITYQAGKLTINKADASVTTPPAAVPALAYTGAAQALVTAGIANLGDVLYALTETGEYTNTIPTGTDAGDYTVWYKVADAGNYNGTKPMSVDVKIGKVNYTGAMTSSTSGRYGMTRTYDLKDLLPAGYALGTVRVSDSSGIFDGTPSLSGTVLTYQLVNNENNVDKSGDIIIPVTSSTNYDPFELTVTVTVTRVRIPDLAVNPISTTYTGSPVPNNSISGTATVDGNKIDGTWSFVDGQDLTNVADSGTKQVTFTPDNAADYGPNTGTVVVTIAKATPRLTLSPSSAAMPDGGTVTLTLSGLPAGGAAAVTCSDESISVTKGTGDTWTADLPAGGASYTFTASYAGDGNHNSATANCTVSVEKITPTLSLSAAPTSLSGGGTVTLTLSGLPAGGTATVTCSGGISVTAGAGNTWTADLPNSTATYTFTASFAGNSSYHPASASCAVETKELIILPNPPAGDDGEELRLVMEEGISQVPEGLKNVAGLETPEKLETAMKVAITQASTVPQANTAVYDVQLLVSTDGGKTWTPASASNFPADGKLTVTLPYPAGTDSSYRFTVVHMFTTSDFGKTPGETEVFTPNQVTNTANGIQFVVTGLSPISVGWEKASTPGKPAIPSNPVTPTAPASGNPGGGSYAGTYAVTVEKPEHGAVASSHVNASSNSTVTLTVTPDSGYVLDTLTVTDSQGNEIKLTAQGDGRYTFTMPSRAVTVKATFAPLPEDVEQLCDGGVDCPSHGFTDLGTVGTWYHEAVDYVLRSGLMNGYTSTTFGPDDNLSRAQLAQILYNKEGRPAVTGGSVFTDVAPGQWYAPAITWAAVNGIVGGYGNGTFGPSDNITREQLAVMLWRCAGSPAATDKELHFTDADQASGYALEALRWAAESGVLSGYGDGRLNPGGLATRAQVAQMLKNLLENQ